MRRILLINPWITDVAAYDLWAWPLGLLYWAARLRQWGFEVGWIDCTDRAHPVLRGRAPSERAFHTGKYHSEPLEEQPEAARRTGRVFRRYGLPVSEFESELDAVAAAWGGAPDAILVTCRMTYWYHGAADAIARCRRRWPRAPIVLGGVYATLCTEHARAHSGADLVVAGDGFEALTQWVRERFPEMAGRAATPSSDPASWPQPAFDLCHCRSALPLLTSVGCPCDCDYCASRLLAPRYARRSAEDVFEEVASHHEQWGTTDFAFYDDALLMESETFFEPFLDRVIASGLPVRFHTPNGLHYGRIGPSLAGLMKRGGVETVRLSLESAAPERLREWRRGGDVRAFRVAVAALLEAGFAPRQVGVYVMAGVPGQSGAEVRQAIEVVRSTGARCLLNEYSPIPGTRLFERAVALSGEEIVREPLWQNNSLYWTRGEVVSREEFAALKEMARRA